MKDREYPAMKWHPETGASEIFNSASDVPEGYLDCHPNSVQDNRPPPAPKAGVLPMTKAEMVAALKAGNIEYPANAGAKALYELLDGKLREHLATNNVPVPEGADVRALLTLIKE